MEKKIEFSDWLVNKYIDWQKANGKRKTVKDFSNWIGVSPGLMSHWMKGIRRPSTKMAPLIAERCGPEVYDALDLARPDPEINLVMQNWYLLTENTRKSVLLEIEMQVSNQ